MGAAIFFMLPVEGLGLTARKTWTSRQEGRQWKNTCW